MTIAASRPLVRVAVLNWNGGDLTARCLTHLAATDWPQDRLELVVVDNGSTDDSLERVAASVPGVRVIQNGANLGFVGLNAAMVDLDGVDFVALVNNDAFVEPGWLAPMVEALEHDAALGAAAARLVFEPKFHELVLDTPTFSAPGDGRELGVQIRGLAVDGRSVFGDAQYVVGCHQPEARPGGEFRWTAGHAVLRVPVPADEHASAFRFADLELEAPKPTAIELCCGRYRLRVEVGPVPRTVRVPLEGEPVEVIQNAGSVLIDDGFGADRGFLEVDEGQFDEPAEVFNICGGGVVFRRSFLEDVGVFDERFFLYYEDTDLSWRGQQLGWRYRYVPEARIRHIHGASGGEGSDVFQFHVERNRLLLLAKNAPLGLAVRQVVAFCRATVAYAVRDILRPLAARHRPRFGLVRNRLRSFVSFLRLLPAMLVERRALARRRVVGDVELIAKWTPRPAWVAHDERIQATAGHAREVHFPAWAGVAGSRS